MLAAIDEGLEALLRAVTPLSAVDIDVAFETPDDEWGAKLTRPTVNLHLWDLRRSTTRAQTGVETTQRNGVSIQRLALPRIEMRYFVSVWTSEHGDERALLSALMVALLGHSEIPSLYVPSSLAELPNPMLALARAGDTDVFQLDGRMKLGLQLTVTTAVDTGAGTPVATAVTDIGISVGNRRTGTMDAPLRRVAGECVDPLAVGRTVRSPQGVATVNETGRFLVAARTGDELVLEIDTPLTVVVPAVGGVVFGGVTSMDAADAR